MKATGNGSLLDLSSVTSIDAGFSSKGNDFNHQQISALDAGVIDLSGVQTITGPVDLRDEIRLIANGAGSVLDLSALQEANRVEFKAAGDFRTDSSRRC